MINDIVIQDGYVNYFDFAICFAELLENGQILEQKRKEDSHPVYVITPAGEEAVSNVQMKLFTTVREKALRSALRLLAFYKTGNRISSDLEELPNGSMLSCKIEDKDKVLIPKNTTPISSERTLMTAPKMYTKAFFLCSRAM